MKAIDRAGSGFLRAVLRRMKESGHNHTTLAARMNASRPYVVKVLHGEVNITLGSAPRIVLASRLPSVGGYARFAHALQMGFIPMLTPTEEPLPAVG